MSHSFKIDVCSSRRLPRPATFSSGVNCFRCFFMRSLHFLNGGTLLHFRMNRNKLKTKGLRILLPFFHHLLHH